VQRLGALLPSIPRPALAPPQHFSPNYRTDPTKGVKKEEAAKAFKKWWHELLSTDVTIFLDGLKQHWHGDRFVGYGYVIYQRQKLVTTGKGFISSMSHVFNAKPIGA
jgi:hypothetical protein